MNKENGIKRLNRLSVQAKEYRDENTQVVKLSQAIEVVELVDEPKKNVTRMNKEKLRDSIESLPATILENEQYCVTEILINQIKVLEMIDQLDEPEKVVVPQFVADWIEKCKDNKHTLYGLFQYATGEVEKWIFESGSKAEKADLIGRGWLDGYEVEKTPQWVVNVGSCEYFVGFFDQLEPHIVFGEPKDGDEIMRFKEKEKAEAVALLTGGKAEEVRE